MTLTSEGDDSLLGNNCNAKLRLQFLEIRFQVQKAVVVLNVPRQGMFPGKRKLNSPLTSLVSSYMARFHY